MYFLILFLIMEFNLIVVLLNNIYFSILDILFIIIIFYESIMNYFILNLLHIFITILYLIDIDLFFTLIYLFSYYLLLLLNLSSMLQILAYSSEFIFILKYFGIHVTASHILQPSFSLFKLVLLSYLIIKS